MLFVTRNGHLLGGTHYVVQQAKPVTLTAYIQSEKFPISRVLMIFRACGAALTAGSMVRRIRSVGRDIRPT